MDQRLVEYCRENLRKFSPDKIRESLVEEGLDAEQIESALRTALATLPPQASTLGPALSWVFLFLVLLGGFALFIWSASRGELEEERRREEKAALEEEEKADKQSPAAAEAAAEEGKVLGYFGYSLRPPPGYVSTEGVCDPARQVETLLIHPADLPPSKVLDTGALLRSGGILLAVRPRRAGAAELDLADLRSQQAPRRPGPGGPETEDVRGLPLPALRVRGSGGRVDTYLQGAHVFYQFSAVSPGKPYAKLLSSLAEPEPRKRMRGFALVEDDPAKGRSYWHDATGTVVTIPPGYSRVPVLAGRNPRYDFAFRSDSVPFEARLRFDSTAELTEKYRLARQKPCFKSGKCPAADPDAPSDLWSAALAPAITAQSLAFDEIPGPLAREEFNADWAILSPGFPLARSRSFNRPYGAGVMLQLHKTGVGNYFLFFLASDFETLSARTNEPKVGLGLRFPKPAGAR